jgi:hypothetical protein
MKSYFLLDCADPVPEPACPATSPLSLNERFLFGSNLSFGFHVFRLPGADISPAVAASVHLSH